MDGFLASHRSFVPAQVTTNDLLLSAVGLGLILLTMVLIGWKCAPTDHEPCHMLFGLGTYCSMTRRDRRRRERLYWFGSK